MERLKKIRKVLAMFLAVAMMTQNIQVTIAGTTTEELDARTSGKTVTQSQPSQNQLDERTSSGQHQTEESQEDFADFLSDGIYEAEDDTESTTAAAPAEDVSAVVTQQIFQQEYSGVLCNFVRMTAQVTNNDTEKAAEGVNIKVLLPASVLSYVNEIGSETAGIEAYAASGAAQAGYLGEVSQDVLNAYADGQSIMWRNQTIGAGQTAAYTFTAQLQDGITDVSGINAAWYVNGSACSSGWVNAEILVPTPEPTEEPVEEPTPEVTEETAQEPAKEPETEATETSAPEITQEPEAEPTETPTPEEETTSVDQKETKRLMKQRSLDEEPVVEDEDVMAAGEGEAVRGSNGEPYSYDINDSNNQCSFNYYVDGKAWDGTSAVPRDASITFHLVYEFDEANKPTFNYYDGYYYTLPSLPAGLQLTTSSTGDVMHTNGKSVIGSYQIDTAQNKVFFTYDKNYVDGKSDLKGTFDLEVQIDSTSEEKEYTVDIGDIHKITFLDSDLEGVKTYTVGDDGYLHFEIVFTAAQADVTGVEVTDTLTGDLSFDENWNPTAVDSHDQTVQFAETPVYNGKTATFKLAKVEYGNPVTITYKVKPGFSGAEASGNNTAQWSWGTEGEGNSKSASADVNVNNHTIDKTGIVEKGPDGKSTGEITYTVVINELAANLIPDDSEDQWISFEDTLQDNVQYVEGSISANSKTGVDLVSTGSVKGVRFEGKTLKFQVLDGICAVITYKVKVLGKKGDTVKVVNTARLTGNVTGSSSVDKTVTLEKSNATLEGVAGTAQFIKKDRFLDQTGNTVLLQGVEFTLYTCSLDGNKTINEYGQYYSDALGIVQFGTESTPLSYDTLYCYKETGLPANLENQYILDSTIERYFILFSDNASDAYKNNILQSIRQQYGNIAVVSGVNELTLDDVNNDKIPTSVNPEFTLKKKLDGSAPADNTFDFVMKFVSYNPAGGKYVAPVAPVYSDMTAKNQGDTVKFAPVELKYEGKYTFEISEVEKTGNFIWDTSKYTVTYEVKWDKNTGSLKVNSTTIKRGTENIQGTPEFNNYTTTSFTLKKDTTAPVKEDTTFTFYLTGKWSDNSDLSFEGVTVNGSQVEYVNNNKTQAKVTIQVNEGERYGSVTLAGKLPKNATISIQETSLPNGWHITTSENDRTITLSNTDTPNEITITNEYAEEGSVIFNVKKEYNDWRKGGESFTFDLTALDGTVSANNTPLPKNANNETVTEVTISGTDDSGTARTAAFGSVKYTQNGTYYYKVKERIPDGAVNNVLRNTEYDSNVTYIKIVVTDGVGGNKTIERYFAKAPDNSNYQTIQYNSFNESDPVATASFTNTYNAQISVQFSGTKVIENAELAGKTFYFYITGSKINTESPNYVSGKGYKVSNNSDGTITFPEITYTQDDLVNAGSREFVYTLTEETANMPSGITADTGSYSVKVTVTKNADGSLSTSVSGKGAKEADYKSATLENNIYKLPNPSGKQATFVNTYGASTQVVFAANKSLSGKALTGNDFTFVITGTNETVYNNSARNTAAGNITFPEISYTVNDLKDGNGKRVQSKEFHYEIKEDISGITPDGDGKYVKDGITYDTTTYNVSVTVTDDGNGELSKVVKAGDTIISPQDGKYWIPVSGTKTKNFENRYDAQTSIRFRGTKVLENKNLENDEFSFILTRTNASGEPLTGTDAYSETVKNDSQGEFAFTGISYNLRDLGTDDISGNYSNKTYYYTIKEDTSGTDANHRKDGVTYDTDIYLITVTVTNNGNGTLSKAVTVNTGTISNGGSGDVYTLTNSNKNNDSITTSPTFKNEYGAATEVKFAGTKVLENKLLTDGDFSFSMIEEGNSTNLTAANEGGTFKFDPITYSLTQLDKGSDGNYNSKEFTYIIKEECADPSRVVNGVTYDAKEYRVSVTVTNEGGGELSTQVRVKENKENAVYRNISQSADGYYYLTEANIPSFTNTYRASTKVQLTGTKQLIKNNNAKETIALQPGDFSFIITGPNLKDGEGNTVESVTVSNDAEGKITFPEIEYQVTDLEKENGNYTNKTFTYTIAEDKTGTTVTDGKYVKDGITYDPVTYKVNVTITNNVTTGKLSESVELVEGETRKPLTYNTQEKVYQLPESDGGYDLPAGKVASFTNMYDATGSFAIPVVKTLVGRKFRTSDSGKFKFYVTKDGKAFDEYVMNITSEDENGNTKKFTFKEDSYDLNDVGKKYLYTVWEGHAKEDQIPGVTTSDLVYQVRVSIEDKTLDGKLELEVINEREDAVNNVSSAPFTEANFQNIYEADGTAQLSAVKNLAPLEIRDGQFDFILTQTDENGVPLTEEDGETPLYSETVTNAGSNVIFTPLQYNEGDVGKTFWYTVTENRPDTPAAGYTYSADVYKVKIEVTAAEDNDNKLKVTKIFYMNDSEEPVSAIVFDNAYKAEGSIDLVGKKELTNGTLEAGKFNFVVTENGNPVATGTNAEDGTITFSTIKYVYDGTHNPLGEHTYEIRETQPTEGDKYIYDTTVRKVVVKVTDNETGKLTAEIVTDKSDVTEQAADSNSEQSVVKRSVVNSFVNREIEVIFRKTDVAGNDLEGAELTLYEEKDGKKDKEVAKWTTDGKDYTVTGLVAGKTYILEETRVPDGYVKASPITFKIHNDTERKVEVISGGSKDNQGRIVMLDLKNGVQILKLDQEGKGLVGAELAVKDAAGNIVEKWTSTGTPHIIEGKLAAGKQYTLTEISAPKGYKLAKDIPFTFKDSEETITVTMKDAPTKASILKVDENGKGLAGAELAIKDSTGTVIEQWETNGAAHVIEAKLIDGAKYTLYETKAPAGYAIADPIAFTMDSSKDVIEVEMKDIPYNVSISKTDLTGEKNISGATLQIRTKDGKVLEEWITDGKSHAVKTNLEADVTYILHEVSAPAGYRMAADIEFTVDKTGKATTVIMKDAPTRVEILKTDENDVGLSGAVLAVKDSSGKTIDQWTSDGKAHVIEGVLEIGKEYTLTEISAPSGYTLAQDMKFTVSKDEEVIKVSMKNYPASGSGKITVTKKVSLMKDLEIQDLMAKDDTFYVNLFTDAEGKYPYKGASPKAIHLVNASSGTVTFDDLAKGTYYVYETDAYGNVMNLNEILKHNGQDFMCMVEDGSNSVELNLKAGNKEGYVNLNNVFYDLPDGYSYRGYIDINKKVLKGTSETTVDDTFYAGVFTRDEDGVYNLVTVTALEQNGTVTVEVPLGGENGDEPVKYYILETDAEGNIVDLDVFEYEVSGEGTVALDKDNLSGQISLVNKVPEEKEGKLFVKKIDGDGVGLAGADFRLTDEEGDVADEWTSEASAYEISLEPGVYTLTEVKAPDGYTGEGEVKITVDEDYNISIKSSAECSIKGDVLKYVNRAVKTTPVPASGGSTGGGSVNTLNTLSGKVAVKTGDDTPIGMYIAILLLAALAVTGTVVYTKKKKSK